MDPHNPISQEVGTRLMEEANKEMALYVSFENVHVPWFHKAAASALETNTTTEGHHSKYTTEDSHFHKTNSGVSINV